MIMDFNARQHMQDLIDRGWQRSPLHPDVIYHPEDHALRIRYNRVSDTLSVSPELEERIDLIILTKRSQTKTFKR